MKRGSIEAFFALVGAGLWADVNHNHNVDLKERFDWKEVCRLAEEQSVVGLVLAGIERLRNANANDNDNANLNVNLSIPRVLLLQWIGEVQVLEQQNKAMNDFIALLIERMRAAGIYTLLVKGQGIAQCYDKPSWRSSGDVDLFLSDDNYTKAKDLLLPMASSVEEEYVREKHLGLSIDGWVVELHGHLYSGLSSKVEKELDALKQDTFCVGQVRTWMNGKCQVFLLKAENDAFYVFTHILQHFYKGGIGLRQICDWCRLLWTYRDSLNYKLLEQRIMRAGLMSEWRAFGAFAVEYLGMPLEAMPFLNENENGNVNLNANDKLNGKLKRKAERIRDFILMSGNFGHNRDNSYFEKYPYLIRKCISMKMRVGDLVRHARIFPLDSLRFFPRIFINGLRSAARGE